MALILMAFCFPISIAASSLVFFPLIGFYFLAGRWTFRIWPPRWGFLETAFALFWGVSLLSALLGVSPLHSRIRLAKDLYFVLIPFLGATLMHDRAQGPKLLRIFLWGGLVTAAFAILQFIVGIDRIASTTPLMNLPPALAHLPQAFLDKLSLIDGRATGLRGHPLTFAETLLFPLAYTLGLLAISTKKTWPKAAVAQCILLLALFYSQSRGSWLAFGVMTLTILWLEPRAYLLRRIVSVMIPIALMISAPTLKRRIELTRNPGNGSTAERFVMWKASLHMIKDHPLLGIGAGNVRLVSAQYQTPAEHTTYGDWGHLHNTYINLVVERGILGLGTFLFLIGGLGWTLFRTLGHLPLEDKEGRLLVLTAFLGLIGWAMSGLTEAVYNDTTILMIFYFVIGIALTYCRT